MKEESSTTYIAISKFQRTHAKLVVNANCDYDWESVILLPIGVIAWFDIHNIPSWYNMGGGGGGGVYFLRVCM